MASEEFLKFNNGQKISFSNFKEIKEEDLKNADAETKRLFNIFAGDDKILQADEAQSLWNKLKTSATTNKSGDNLVFDIDEMQNILDTDVDIQSAMTNSKFGINALTSLLSQLFTPKTNINNPLGNVSPQVTAAQREKACKETVIGIIDDNISEAYQILNSQSLGAISGAYDNNKDDDDKLKTSNVRKVLDYQQAGEIQMIEAKNGNLTKRAYYEENKQRIKDMILTRLTVLEASSGVNFLDQYKGKYTKEQLTKIISDYVDTICNNVEMDKLKEMQKQFVSFSVVEEVSVLDNFVNNAIDYSENHSEIKLNTMGGEGKPITIKNPKGIVPSYWDSAEPITFEEVYKIERGTEYSQYKVEQYVLAKKEMETVASAYNRKQQFVDAAKSISNDNSLSVDAKLQKIMELYSEFYALVGDDGLGELKKIVESSNTLIKFNENGLDLSAYQSNEPMKQIALNKLLSTAISQKEKDFENFLGGKTIEEYQEAFERAANDILGEDNAKMLSEAMKNDNMTVIQRWTGNTSMVGMGLTVIGGILCFTPLAPIGAAMVK